MTLVIRDAQMKALQLATDERWYDRQLACLYPEFADAAAPQRRCWIREGISRALDIHLDRSEIFQFLCFEQTFGPGCLDDAQFEWARKLLEQADKPPGERMTALRHESIRRLLLLEAELEQSASRSLAEPDKTHDASAVSRSEGDDLGR
jgi:hypothetical protein